MQLPPCPRQIRHPSEPSPGWLARPDPYSERISLGEKIEVPNRKSPSRRQPRRRSCVPSLRLIAWSQPFLPPDVQEHSAGEGSYTSTTATYRFRTRVHLFGGSPPSHSAEVDLVGRKLHARRAARERPRPN